MSIGVLFGGCGHYDGTDVAEAVFTLLAIETAGERAILVAPDIEQERCIDHRSGDEVKETRNVLHESARLSRRPVSRLQEIRPEDLEALLIPGGYGPVVNFSTAFARRHEPHAVRPEVAAFLRHFLDTGKPIGCVSLGEIPVKSVLGEAIDVPETPKDPAVLTIDRGRNIVYTPGTTAFTRLADVRAGIAAMVEEVLGKVREKRRQAVAAERGTLERP